MGNTFSSPRFPRPSQASSKINDDENLVLVAATNHTQESVMDAVIKGERLEFSPEAVARAPRNYDKLVRRCWRQDPESRPHMGRVMSALKKMEDSIVKQSPLEKALAGISSTSDDVPH